MNSHFLISAPSSNSGKTTLTLGLLRALKKRNLTVQPFKCGPDYIDPIHHTQAAGNQSINLDTFMSSQAHVTEIYENHSYNTDVAVTEGVMGLFDGADKMQGSSAAIAELLSIPVILVVDARSMAYSAAPLLFGFKNFYPRINVAGVIFNFVNTTSHYSFLQDACADVGMECLGYLPKNSDLVIPSRHLGLHISAETDYEKIIENASEEIEKTVDLNRLLAITQRENALNAPSPTPFPTNGQLKITIARDEAFAFRYHQNIAALSTLGSITWFSPLHDSTLPDTDLLYLPGGYPELFARELNANQSMRQSIQNYCEKGGLTYAECGGLMYLGQTLTTSEGDTFAMAEVLDCSTSMLNSKMTLGYRIGSWNGFEFRGHEFHYSNFENNNMTPIEAIVTNAKCVETETKIYQKHNTFASYMHVYWGDNKDFILNLINITKKEPTADR